MMAKEENLEGLASELHPNQNKVMVGTTQSGETATASTGKISGKKVDQSEKHATGVTMERKQTCAVSTPEGLISNTIYGDERGKSTMSDVLVSEALQVFIVEAKKVLMFDKISKDLASTMESILPIITQIESMQIVGELNNLKNTISRALVVVDKCSGVKRWDIHKKTEYRREVEEISKDLLKFCQVELQLLMLGNQVQSGILMEDISDNLLIVNTKLEDLLSVSPTGFMDLCSIPKLDKVIVGLDLPLVDLKKKLLDSTVDTLVVSALGGCGKTTLVTHLCHDTTIIDEFKNILFNVVSRDPDFRVLVQNLLKHNGNGLHTFDNDNQAKVALRNLLEKLKDDGPILLVLDDVWRGAESLLENFRIDVPGYKILVTSRFVFPSFGSSYHLAPLEDKDARVLLVHWASQPDHTSPKEYEELLKKILKRCNGNPLVIEVIGASLRGRPLSSWKDQVESWSKGETIFDNPTVLECLQPSFDALNSNLKERFMDLGSFREDQKIRASVIIDIWVELYSKGSSMCMKDLDGLASQNLLKVTPLGGNQNEDEFYNDFLVTQHDILRDLAICQSKYKEKRLNLEIREDKYPDWIFNLEQPINARLLSISTDDFFSSTWVDMKLMDLSSVEALVLNLSSTNYALLNFIATMKKLKVVVIIDHSSTPAKLKNFWCLSHLSNLKRIRLEKVSITLLNISGLQLGNLQKLSLVMCSFCEVFYDAIEEIDVSKGLPSLREIEIDFCYDLVELPYWISEVDSLKTLSITNCNHLTRLPEAIGNLSNLEVLRLSSCINLFELPETTEKLSNLQFLDISDCLGLRKLPQEIGNLQKLKKISMSKCWRCELPDSVTRLENLVVKCDEETRMVLWEKLKPTMRNLKVHQEEIELNMNMFKMF